MVRESGRRGGHVLLTIMPQHVHACHYAHYTMYRLPSEKGGDICVSRVCHPCA